MDVLRHQVQMVPTVLIIIHVCLGAGHRHSIGEDADSTEERESAKVTVRISSISTLVWESIFSFPK